MFYIKCHSLLQICDDMEEIGDPRLIDVSIGSIKFRSLVDSGASVNTVTPFIWEQIKKHSRSAIKSMEMKPEETLKGYANNQPLKVECSFSAVIVVGIKAKRTQEAKFFVVHDTKLPLLSYKTACDLNILKIGMLEKDMILAVSEAEKEVKEFPKIPIEGGVKIRINENVPPRQIIRYNIPLAFQEATEQRLKLMEEKGIIERADSEGYEISSVSPMVLTPKDVNDFRICIDYREANKRIEREPYPLPQLEKIWTEIPQMEGGERLRLTVLDLSDAFFHVELHESVRHITTFMTSNGLMRFTRLPFGLSCAPELFQKTMERLLNRCKGTLVYLDDILIFGKSSEELKDRTEKVKDTLLRNNLTINQKKSKYDQESVEFLGFTIDGKGITPTQKKISDIKSFRRPKSSTQLRSFLGMMTFISPFIKDFSHKTKPLRELLTDEEFGWKIQHTTAFEELKRAAEEDIVKRGYFCEKDKTILYTDASPWGLGAVLVQISRKTGERRIIACASKSLTPAECRYPQLHREALAIVWAMERFIYYLLGRHFTLRSDSEALMFMTKYKSLKADNGKRILTRAESWFLRLEHFDYDFEHVAGKDNIADAASRISKKESAAFDKTTRPQELFAVWQESLTNCERILKMEREKIKQASKEDREIQTVIKGLNNNKMSLHGELINYNSFKQQLFVEEDVLMKEGKIVLPKNLQSKAISEAHESHAGVAEMKFKLRQTVWWLDMNKDISEKVRRCEVCQLSTLNSGREISAVTESQSWGALTIEEVRKEMQRDDEMKLVKDWIGKTGKWPEPISSYQPFQKDLNIQDDKLMKRDKIVLPKALRDNALKIAHVAHPGMSKMKSLLRQNLWWPGMDRQIESFVKSCPYCQLVTDTSRPLPIVQTRLPNNPWDCVSMDFSTASDKEGWKALILTDHYSRFLVAIPMDKTDTQAVKNALTCVFQTYYYPKTLRADNGPPFNSFELGDWLKKLGITFEHTTPLNPTENGLVERHMQGINKISAITRLEKRNWKKVLAEYMAAYNTWPHCVTKLPPAELMFGRAIRSLLPCIKTDETQFMDEELRDKDQVSKFQRNQAADEKRGAVETIDIQIGDKILMKQQKKDKADTIYKNEFFKVLEIEGAGRVKLEEVSTGKIFWRNVKHLKKFIDKKKPENSIESEVQENAGKSPGKNLGCLKFILNLFQTNQIFIFNLF